MPEPLEFFRRLGYRPVEVHEFAIGGNIGERPAITTKHVRELSKLAFPAFTQTRGVGFYPGVGERGEASHLVRILNTTAFGQPIPAERFVAFGRGAATAFEQESVLHAVTTREGVFENFLTPYEDIRRPFEVSPSARYKYPLGVARFDINEYLDNLRILRARVQGSLPGNVE